LGGGTARRISAAAVDLLRAFLSKTRTAEQLPSPATDIPGSTASPQKTWRTPDVLLILLICAMTFFYGLGRLALIGPDEPRYAEVAREMFESSDYVSTRLCGCLWFEKPALLYWVASVSYRVLGVNELAARIPSAASACLMVLILYYAVAALVSRRMGMIVAAVAATSGIIIGYGRVAAPDMLLTAAMTCAVLAGFAAVTGDANRRTARWALCGAALGLGALAKGLVAIVLVPVIIGAFMLFQRRLGALRLAGLAALSGCCVLVCALWYLPVTLRHRWLFVDEFLIKHHFNRYTSDQFHHPQPFYFFLVVAILGTLPWAPFMIPALGRIRRLKPLESRIESLLMLAWLWAGVPLLFFSLSGSKLPGYILPVFPALAIVIGFEVEKYISGERSLSLRVAGWILAGVVTCLPAVLILYLRRFNIDAPFGRWIFAGLLLVCAAAALGSVILKREKLLPATTVAAVCVAVVAVVLLSLSQLNETQSLKPMSLDVYERLEPGERICFFIKKEFAPVFYDRGRVICDFEGMDVLNALREDILARALELEAGKHAIVITTSNWRRGLETDPRFDVELLSEQGDALAYRVRLRW